MFTNKLNLFTIISPNWKDSPGSGNILSGKEKVLGAVVSKGDVDSVLDMKGSVTIDFIEKGATVNSDSYCQLLRQYFPLLNDPSI